MRNSGASAFVRAVVIVAMLLDWPFLAVGSALAGEAPSAADLLKALQGTGTRAISTEGAGAGAVDAGATDLLARLREKDVRAITIEDRAEVAAVIAKKPQVDLEITFASGSAAITPEAVPTLIALGQALSDGGLAGATFVVAGHTDRKGAAAFNQSLSKRRALAVKRFLVDQIKLAESRVIALGYGFERPKNEADPFADENRRVQIVNMAE